LSGPPTTRSGTLKVISPDVGDSTSFTPNRANPDYSSLSQ
jgi:hypothetical protein